MCELCTVQYVCVLIKRTCANVEHIIVSVLCLHMVHGQLGEVSAAACLQQDRSLLARPHRVEHQWMGAHKTQNLIWKVLRARELPSIYFTGTLEGERKGRRRKNKTGHSEQQH